MSLESSIFQELEYPQFFDFQHIEKFATEIPSFNENDPNNPEWRETPTILVDLSKFGYGQVYIKNEADTTCNPTGTIKDRLSWEITTISRDYAKLIELKKKEKKFKQKNSRIRMPRFSIITSGNAANALSYVFKKFNLPPIKILIDKNTTEKKLSGLKNLYADIYLIDLEGKPLSPNEINEFTNNKTGIDITSVKIIEPNSVFYDWHVHEAFNQSATNIFIPYGSGRLWENYLTWQEKSIRNHCENRPDPRLKIPINLVANMNILGAEPQIQNSIADKLTKPFNPFTMFKQTDISTMSTLNFTGNLTNIYQVPEEKIIEAHKILNLFMPAEPSAAAGLALYFLMYEKDQINPKEKNLIINTGKGIQLS